MTPTPDTQILYKELRSALLTRNDAAALTILQQIVSINPHDAAAARQLAEISARVKSNGGTGKEQNAITKEKYKKYRSACLAHNDEEAFSLLEEIIQLDALDQGALQQRADVGKRIAKAKATTITAALQSGDTEQITRIVEELRRYAPDDFLNSIPDFSAALSIYNAAKSKKLKKQFDAKVAELQEMTTLAQKQEMALSIERFASENSIIMDSETSKRFQQIHSEWQEWQCLNEQKKEFSVLQEEYAAIRAQLRAQENLTFCWESLLKMQEKAKALHMIDELEPFLKRLELAKEKIRLIKRSELNKKMLKRAISTLMSVLALGTFVLLAYAYNTVDKRCMELRSAVEAKNVADAKVLLEKGRLLSHLYKRINSAYAVQLSKTENWLRGHNILLANLREYSSWLTENKGHSSIEHIETLLVSIHNADTWIKELREQYNSPPPSKLLSLHQAFKKEVQVDLKDQALERYLNPPPNANMAQLAKLYEEYKRHRNILQLNATENKKVREKYDTLCRDILLSDLHNRSTVENAYHLAQTYANHLELSDDVITQLKTLLSQYDSFEKLPDILANCTTLKDYISKLQQHRECLTAASFDVPFDDYEKILNNIAILKIRLYLERRGIRFLDVDEMQKRLEQVKQVYSNKKSLFENQSTTELSRITNLMTQPGGPAWSDKFKQVHGIKEIQIGTISIISQRHILREVLPNGTYSRQKQDIPATSDIKPLLLFNLRKSVGIERDALLRGKILPTTIMSNLAKFQTSEGSPLARAYLYSLAIDLLKTIDNVSNGMIFSESLWKDVKSFEELKTWVREKDVAISENCWLLKHKVQTERKLNSFFSEASKHDYASEIKNTISRLESDECILAGYVNKDGKFVSISSHRGKVHYYARGTRLVPYKGQRIPPYTPIISLNIE